MIPLQLEINAFGSFAAKQQIDFTNLQGEKLFLITGATGSGKTTIFDAISYALFGRTSGTSRTTNQIRSDYATPEQICEVTYTFSMAGKEYSVYRCPKQNVISKKGKLREQKPSVVFTMPDGEVIASITEANEMIEQIIGLKYNQFSQIVMLPQGEFKKFLESKTLEKESILRQIFSTDIFRIFQEKLKQKAKEITSRLEQLQQKQEYHISLIKTEDSNLSDMIYAENKDLLGILESLEKDIDFVSSITQKLESEKISVESDIKGINIDFAKSINNKINEYNNQLKIKQNLDSEKDKIQDLKLILDKGKKAQIINGVQKDIEKNTGSISHYKEKLISIEQQISKTKIKHEELKTQVDSIPNMQVEMEQLSHNYKDLELMIQKLSQIAQQKEMLIQQQSRLSKYEHNYSILQVFEKRIGLKEELEKNDQRFCLYLDLINKGKDYIGLQYKFAKRQVAYAHIYELYIKGQAGIIAQQLDSGEPCPVCGSKRHPNIAQILPETPTKKQVDEIKNQLDTMSSNLVSLESEIEYIVKHDQQLEHIWYKKIDLDIIKELEHINNKLEISINKQQTEIEELTSLYSPKVKNINSDNYWDREWIAESLQKHYGEITSYKSKIELMQNHIEDMENQIPIDKKEIDLIEKDRENCNNKYTEIKSKIDYINTNNTRILGELERLNGEFGTTQEYIKRIEQDKKELEIDLGKKIDQFGFLNKEDYEKYLITDQTIDNYTDVINDFNSRYMKNETLISTLSKDVLGYKIFDVDNMEKELLELNNQLKYINNEINNKIQILQNNKQQQTILKDITKQFKDDEKIYSDMQVLHKLAGGNNPNKISFESYVLSSYFQDILRATNIQLYKMTQGRFTVKYREERERGNASSGLGMDVFDSHTGKYRHTNTLSGGESFMLSLSLALGLSDVIQNWSGGIRLDTMFIDEGFGSLDEQSLDQAITTLKNLQNEGRVIGIISHVQELKERIPVHLNVCKEKQGSSVSFFSAKK